MAVYYDIPIELIRVIHKMCEPEGYGEFHIADARLYNSGPDYFADYKKRWLIEIVEDAFTSHLKRIYTTFRGKKHGEYKVWRNNGQLYLTTSFTHGKRCGEYKHYHENGQIYIQSFYVNDQRHGEYKVLRNTGELMRDEIYDNGVRVQR